jgi:hypothetical protein
MALQQGSASLGMAGLRRTLTCGVVTAVDRGASIAVVAAVLQRLRVRLNAIAVAAAALVQCSHTLVGRLVRLRDLLWHGDAGGVAVAQCVGAPLLPVTISRLDILLAILANRFAGAVAAAGAAHSSGGVAAAPAALLRPMPVRARLLQVWVRGCPCCRCSLRVVQFSLRRGGNVKVVGLRSDDRYSGQARAGTLPRHTSLIIECTHLRCCDGPGVIQGNGLVHGCGHCLCLRG